MQRERLEYLKEKGPEILTELLSCPPLKRIDGVGMNCGVEYTSFPFFANLAAYSRLEHSLDCARIVLHFGGNTVQAVSALFHDIASPCFSHVVDFLKGDYVKQESTEEGTLAKIKSPSIRSVLNRYGISVYDVADYHRFPLCDNDAPKLSADRLEYTLSNLVNFGIVSKQKAQVFYDDLVFDIADNGEKEIMFSSFSLALEFGLAALENSYIYVCREDRGSMEKLSELLGKLLREGLIEEKDLYKTEKALIRKIESGEKGALLWQTYRKLDTVILNGENLMHVPAKKRYIDPFIKGQGRLSKLAPEFAKKLEEFLSLDFSEGFDLR